MDALKKKARQLFPKIVLIDEPLKKHTTFKIGGPADFFFKAKNLNALKKIITFCKKNKLKIFVIGNGSNLLFLDKGFKGAIIKLTGDFKKIKLKKRKIIQSGAATPLQKLSDYALKKGLTGLEWAKGLPATLAGAIATNAGAFGQNISKNLINLLVLDTKTMKISKVAKEEIKFNYRFCGLKKNQIILEAQIKLEPSDQKTILEKTSKIYRERKNNQPLNFPSAGCIFKNPSQKKAGQLIEQCGLKGFQIGGAKISEKHANFIVNTGQAKADNVLKLMKLAKREVKKKFKINLKEEIIFIK